MNLKYWHIAGAIFTLVIGTLLHFTYEWSNENTLVGIFSAVNESTWEHLKLLFTPVLLFAAVEYCSYGKYIPNFVPVKALSILLGMSTIVISFYTYTGIIGQNFLWADISTFILGVLAAYWFSIKYLRTGAFTSECAIRLGWLGLLLLFLCFAFFTFIPPRIELFLDPVSGTYGI
ncbi:MAG TPA: DUF6512 family protein [Clostridia bacterium]|nr:DUF6512 family protein [Clostridia bacterium]